MRGWVWTNTEVIGQVLRLSLCGVWTEPSWRTSPKAHPRGPETAAARTGVRPQEAGGGQHSVVVRGHEGEKQLGKEWGTWF